MPPAGTIFPALFNNPTSLSSYFALGGEVAGKVDDEVSRTGGIGVDDSVIGRDDGHRVLQKPAVRFKGHVVRTYSARLLFRFILRRKLSQAGRVRE